jgi:outer membrane protein OmpA-like peptidoglycan-associated protein
LLESIGGNSATGAMETQQGHVDSLAGSVIFNADGADGLLTSWVVKVTDEQGNSQQYGPYTQDKASVPGKMILGNNAQGNYSVVMTGQTKTGQTIRKETVVSLYKMNDAAIQGLRYSVLFNFDKSKTVSDNEKFLADVIAPLITDSSTVIIHGHTDIIGDKDYNLILSDGRVRNARDIIESGLSGKGRKGVKLEYYGFGKDAVMAPFNNNLPEERFYNRTVIIDIIQGR